MGQKSVTVLAEWTMPLTMAAMPCALFPVSRNYAGISPARLCSVSHLRPRAPPISC